MINEKRDACHFFGQDRSSDAEANSSKDGPAGRSSIKQGNMPHQAARQLVHRYMDQRWSFLTRRRQEIAVEPKRLQER